MDVENKTIIEILDNIKNNQYVMPAFQREFEWDLDRIEKLWDSILQGYPFSTFLFWGLDEEHVTKTNFFYIFAKKCCFDSNGKNDGCDFQKDTIDFKNPKHPTIAVLDGQQRLTSLYLSLFGETYKRAKRSRKKSNKNYKLKLYIELDESKINDVDAFNSKKYSIYFTDRVANATVSQFELKRILEKDFSNLSTRTEAIKKTIENIPERQKNYAKSILEKLCQSIYDKKLITYTKVSNLSQDDALEMFVRFNSGGKNLTKAQISMSILEIYWPNVKKDFSSLLSGKFSNFSTDFILRTAHMIYGDVVKSNIDQVFADSFKSNFGKFSDALIKTIDLFDMMRYDISRFSSRWNVIIPIIYLIYNNDSYIDCINGIFAYLFRSILFQYYSSGTTGKLNSLRRLIYENGFILTPKMLDEIIDLKLSDSKIDDLLLSEKGSQAINNILYCLGINYIDDSYDYDEDHIYCIARFEREKPLNINDNDWKIARTLCNKLPNIQLLVREENESKGDAEFNDYFLSLKPKDKEKMISEGFIPKPKIGVDEYEYYKFDNFLNFYNDRRQLLRDRIKALLKGE